MENNMNIFFDTEFSKLHKKGFLISLGCVDDNGNEFYWEAINYEESECSEFVVNEVLPALVYKGFIKDSKTMVFSEYIGDKSVTHIVGDKHFVKKYFTEWLSKYDSVQFTSDVCHYDFVFLIDIFGDAYDDLPKNIAPVCYDINQDIASYFNISNIEAFNMNREEIVSKYINDPIFKEILISGSIRPEKHNSLYDAIVIKDIYKIVSRTITTRK
jgi:hypothetical protein